MIRFAEFALDPVRGQLLRAGTPVELQPKPYELLLRLTSEPGRLLSREELDAALWPDETVTEASLSQAVRRLRTALGDPPRNPRFVETVPRRGYRWIGAVVAEEAVRPEPRRTLLRPEDAFFGRSAEAVQLRTALEQSRLVSVVGPGGIGKTRLALQLDEVAACCRLGSVTDEASLHVALAEALSLPPDGAGPAATRAALAQTQDLVLLDEAEGVAEIVAAALVGWLAETPARFLVTSRRRLGLAAERCIEPRPPARRRRRRAVRRPRRRRGARRDGPRGRGAAPGRGPRRLAARRRSPPRAARCSTPPPCGSVARSLSVLDQPRADRPARQRRSTPRSVELDLLSDAERVAAARLSAFPGGLALSTGEQVLADQPDPLGLLEALRQRSWLQRTGDRFEQYAPLRRYAGEQCDAMGLRADATAGRRRHRRPDPRGDQRAHGGGRRRADQRLGRLRGDPRPRRRGSARPRACASTCTPRPRSPRCIARWTGPCR
ncbi:MAG: winged helix-turn-helix domain-containing protein [Myxococcota bacterium]